MLRTLQQILIRLWKSANIWIAQNKEYCCKLQTLHKLEDLFDGSLGTWKTNPIQLELKDPDCKPYHAKPYPVPQSQEKRLKDEIKKVMRLWSSEEDKQLRMGLPNVYYCKAKWLPKIFSRFARNK
jgi:hypothetical protein